MSAQHEKYEKRERDIHADPYERSPEVESCYGSCQSCCGLLGGFLATWICCLCCETPYKRIMEGTAAIVTEYGKFKKLYPPGLYFVNPCTESLTIVEKREQVMEIRQKSVITKDNINVLIDFVVYYQIENSYKAVYAIENLDYSIGEIAITSLRDVFGITTLQDALEERDKTAEHLYEIISGPAASWGVNIKRVLLQEIRFTPELQRTLSSAATAKRLAESKVISAKADVEAAKLMRTASDMLSTPSAMQIRYLESIGNVGKAGNPKIVFFPSDYQQAGSNPLSKMGNNKM